MPVTEVVSNINNKCKINIVFCMYLSRINIIECVLFVFCKVNYYRNL